MTDANEEITDLVCTEMGRIVDTANERGIPLPQVMDDAINYGVFVMLLALRNAGVPEGEARVTVDNIVDSIISDACADLWRTPAKSAAFH